MSGAILLLKQVRFPFHQGRFQGRTASSLSTPQPSFHSTKEGFKADEQKVHLREQLGFHSTKEGFKEQSSRTSTKRPCVSIPPRKVSRAADPTQPDFSQFRFHSTKEGFKVYRQAGTPKYGCGFHSTKEGFKGTKSLADPAASTGFHSTKEGFKGGQRVRGRDGRSHVSIPPRKVSRVLFEGRDAEVWQRFHSTKEGFKAGRGGDVRMKALVGFHSTKEGFKESPLPSIAPSSD